MKEGRDLVKEALQDAKSLKEAAVERAKNEIVESLAPAVRKLLENNLKEAERGVVDFHGSNAGKRKGQEKDRPPYGSPKGVSEEADLTLEDTLQELFPAEQGIEEKKKMSKHSSERASKEKKSGVNESGIGDELEEGAGSSCSSVSEEIEISENELRKVYEAALQTEVNVKKGFGDVTGFVELGGKTAGNEHSAAGVPFGDEKGGEHEFDKVEPPHKKDWIPESKQLNAMIQKGLAENKALRLNLRKAVAMVETLGKKLHEVNLFNAKVLHVNKILNSGARLSTEQKTFVMESIDKARTISEVKMVFETIVGSIATQSQINESRSIRPPKANAQGARTTGTPRQSVLSESVDRAQNQEKFSRVKQLAGLVK